MKSKCSFILKASTALVLALLMLFGSVSAILSVISGPDAAEPETVVQEPAKSAYVGGESPSSERGIRDLAGTGAQTDIVDTGAKVDLAESGWTVENGARVYFNAYARGSGAGSGNNLKKYVYMAFLYNSSKQYQIIKMDHIAETELYTCYTSSANINYNNGINDIFFFSSDASGWATKASSEYGNARANVVSNCGGFCSNTYGASAYNNHVYYYTIDSSYNLSLVDKDGNGNIANNDSVTNLKAGQQKASVYISTDASTYTFNSTDNTKGGDVVVGGYGWKTGYEVTDKTFAPSSKTNSDSNAANNYSYFDKPVLTTWITMMVNEVYDGWHFMGWYDTDGNLLESSSTYYYQLSTNDPKDVHARFLKPEYTSATPKDAYTLASGQIILKKKTATPERVYIWNYGSNYSSSSQQTVSQMNSSSIYGTGTLAFLGSSATNSGYPKAIAYKGAMSDGNKISGDITDSGSTPSSRIWYFPLNDNTSAGNWTLFEHLGATGLTNDKTTASIGEEVTLTATAPSAGTLKDDPYYNYYYSTDGGTNWYKIAENSTSNTQKFYPPANGVYTYKVAVQDNCKCETVVATAGTSTTVGVVNGKYVTGLATLVGGTNWATAPAKGLMTETPASSGIYKLTFGNVAAGTYQFRVTTLNADGTITWETSGSTPAPTGTASPTITNTNNVTFTLTEKKQVTITYNDSTKAVAVDVADVQAIDVVVYAGNGGYVDVTYGTAVTTIPKGEHMTVKVAYGDSINLEATNESGYSFVKWYKNLTDNYSAVDSLEGEVITGYTVYVACFSSSGAGTDFDDSSYTTEGTNFSIKYSTGNDGSTYNGSSGTALSGTVYRSGSYDYWIELTSAELAAWKTALDSGQVRWNLFYNSTAQITDKAGTDARYMDPSTGNLKNCEDSSDNTLLIKSKPEDYSSNKFIELSRIDTSVTSLGIHINTNTKKVDYYFGTGSGTTTVDYIPSTNFYAKDASVRNVTGESVNGLQYNFWIYPTRTEVKAVEGQINVSADHAANVSAIGGHNQWVEGLALKGSQITVTTIIPHRTSYKVTDSSGADSNVNADEKYYVRGFSFNGVTPKLIEESEGVSVSSFTTYDTNGATWTGSGTAYSCTYTIPADMKEAKLEITPILFVKDAYASNTVMVYINGYNDSVKEAGWGNTLYVYPFYQYRKDGTSSGAIGTYYGQGENFGRYPGQPVINYGGQLFMQIPLTDDATAKGKDNNGGQIKGITINNGYYDYVHKDCCSHVSVHRQTYDYDDFAKIYNQKKMKDGEKYLYSIYFSFKYFAASDTQHRLSGTTEGITGDSNASRYNDLLASGNILNDTTGTVASATLIAAGEGSTGWQDLEDSLGNDVDIFGNKVTDASAEPLRVFSLGYEYNNSGRWATEWAVYHLNGANYELIYDDAWGIDSSSGHNNKYYNSSIVPSALIYNDKASLAAAISLDGDQPISGYAGLYENLEAYRGIPVKICYEHDIPDAFSPKNYRCDGRWTYTTVDDFVRSNIKIQYYDKDGVLHDDTIDEGAHVGNTTGCSAYFTNPEYYGATTSTSQIINNAESYTFKAENKGSYEFAGWYLYDTAGHESTITKTDLEADTPRSGNFVLAARFKYIASGNLVISNTLNADSVGRGITYLGVTVKNGNKENILVNVNTNTAPYTLDKSYINANSNYQIIVELRTVPIGENTFASYACYTTDGHLGTDERSAASNTNIYSSSNSAHTTDTYTITVKGDIFSSTVENQQDVKAIEYISTLNAVHYTYNVKFNYTSRQYGDQAFTKSGELTVGQINDDTVVTGTTNTADKKLTAAFLASIAPHESNFNDTISWDFGAVVDSQSCTYTSGSNTYAITLTIGTSQQTHSSDLVRHGYFTVPYAQTDGIATAVGGKVAKTGETTFNVDANYDNLFKISDNFVTAPAVIYETVDGVEKERYFKYWEISTAAGKRGDSRVIGKCYYPEFNYRALDNYNVRAVYSVEGERLDGSTDNTSSPIISANSFAQLYGENSFTTIDFIGNTRNQWNNDDNGSHTYYAGDLIYNDFILTFKPQSMDLIKDLTDDVDCGFVIQRLKEIETNASGTNAKTLQDYAKDYTAADLAAAKEAAKTMAGGTTTVGYTQIKVTIDKGDINNKNRCHYAYAMWNTNQRTNGGTVYPASGVNSNTKYLYRAYSYMKIGTDEYIMSEVPTYFYMYDIARE